MANATSPPQRPFLILAILALVVAGLYWAQAVLIPIALAVLLTFILTPAVAFFQHHGFKRVFAVALVVLLAITILCGLVYVLTDQVQDLAQTMADNAGRISRKIAALRGSSPDIVTNVLGVFEKIGQE